MAAQRFYWMLLPALLCAALTDSIRAAEPKQDPKTILLMSQGPDGHPPGTHEYTAGMRVLTKCLQRIDNLQVNHVAADGQWLEGPGLIKQSDAVVLFLSEGARWIHEDPRRLEALAQLASRGGGFVALHWGMGTKDAQYIEGYLKLFGGCHGGPDRKYKSLQTSVKVAQADHPITAGIRDFDIQEEFYYRLKFVDAGSKLKPILQVAIDGNTETVAWAWERGDGGRSFGFSGGHFHRNWRQLEYQRLMSQAVLWTLKLPIPADGLDIRISPEDLELD